MHAQLILIFYFAAGPSAVSVRESTGEPGAMSSTAVGQLESAAESIGELGAMSSKSVSAAESTGEPEAMSSTAVGQLEYAAESIGQPGAMSSKSVSAAESIDEPGAMSSKLVSAAESTGEPGAMSSTAVGQSESAAESTGEPGAMSSTAVGQSESAAESTGEPGAMSSTAVGQSVSAAVEPNVSHQTGSLVTFTELIPIPHRHRPHVTKPRKKHPSYEITSSQCIAFVEERTKRKPVKKSTSLPHCSQQSKPKVAKRQKQKQVICEEKTDSDSQADYTACLYCEIRYCESDVDWIKCKVCNKWACGHCAHLGKKVKKVAFICDGCK